ncbi:hypothetical protein GALL_495500 [mine drainage metagenome]|uniref:Uncharacterized protein n=1 Tax=mine drainage metagenome TaxID=410659 RepID=A0A1J5PYY3_9ZZZZ
MISRLPYSCPEIVIGCILRSAGMLTQYANQPGACVTTGIGSTALITVPR